jgi:Arrestin (or S-antigen), N-terminal domain
MGNQTRAFAILDPPDEGPYFPGDQISGRAILLTHQPETIGSVRVIFRCIIVVQLSNTSGGHSANYRDKETFFSFESVLYEGSVALPPSQYEWPFHFVVPTALDPNLYTHKSLDQQTSTSRATTIHLPPPTLNSASNGILSKGYRCAISYQINTKVTRKTFQWLYPSFKTLKDTNGVHVRTRRETEVLAPCMISTTLIFNKHKHIEKPTYNGQNLRPESFRAAFRDRFADKAKWLITLDLGIQTVFLQGDIMQVTLNPLKLEGPSPSGDTTLYLKRVEMSLIAMTLVEVKGREMGWENIVANWTHPFSEFPLTKPVELQNILNLRLPRTSPSIRCRYAARGYALAGSITVEYGGLDFQCHFRCHGIVIHSKYF